MAAVLTAIPLTWQSVNMRHQAAFLFLAAVVFELDVFQCNVVYPSMWT